MRNRYVVRFVVLPLICGLVVMSSVGAPRASAEATFVPPAMPSVESADAPALGAETVPIRLVLDGHEYYKNACIPAHIRLVALQYGSWQRCFEALSRGGADPRSICNWLAYPLGDDLAAWLARYEVYPRDAEVEIGERSPRVRPHRDGSTVGDEALLAALAACLERRAAPPLALRYTPALVRTDELERRVALVSSFSTAYADHPDRVHNLCLACRALNGYVLPAGQTFSFNGAVGPRTAERGYLPAKIIRDGAYVEGVGGGVCQVSTTLYNAAMLAGLEQVEAHPHSLAVHYVEPSRDAMVSGWSDMRFRNDTAYPVYIFARAERGRVTVRLYGVAPSAPVRLEVRSTVVEPRRNVDADGKLLSDTDGYDLLAEGQDGVRGTLVRTMGGERTVLRTNVYPRRDAVWKRTDTAPPEGDN